MGCKPYCEVDVVDCTCDDGICHGKKHQATINQWNTLRGYGLSAEEALDDMSDRKHKEPGK